MLAVDTDKLQIKKGAAVSSCRFAYEKVAEVDRSHFWYICRNEQIFRAIQTHLPNYQTAKVLEVGSGCGNVSGYLYEHGVNNINGWDIDPRGLDIARRRNPNVPYEYVDFLTAWNDDGEEKKFDAVGMFDALEHFSDEHATLLRASSMLRKDGLLFVTVPAMPILWSKMDEYYGHFKRYTADSLKTALVRAGFTVHDCKYFMGQLVPLLLLRRRFKAIPQATSSDHIEQILIKDCRLPKWILNETMKWSLRMESRLGDLAPIPFGSSLIAVASKNSSHASFGSAESTQTDQRGIFSTK